MSSSVACAPAALANDFGDDFAYGAGTIYLNNASASLMPRPSIGAMTDFLTEYNASGPDSDAADRLVSEKMKSARAILSRILSCHPDEIAFTQSTTDGINIVARGLRTLASGSRVIIRGMEHEHHANLYPWLHLRDRGVEIRSLGIDRMGRFSMAELSSLLAEDGKDGHCTRLVALSHALYNTGAILPVDDAGRMMRDSDDCHYGNDGDHNNNNDNDTDGADYRCRFFVDAAQTIGCLDTKDCAVSAIGCDYMSFNGSKWLCGPMGMGVFYCRRDSAHALEPVMIGGESATMHGNNQNDNNTTAARLEFKNAPDKFQTGFRNYAGIAGLEASLRYLQGVGFGRIRSKNRSLSELLKDNLDGIRGVTTFVPDDGAARTSIVSFNVEGHAPRDVVARLQRQGMVLAVRELGSIEMIRASPHFFNTEAQMHALADAVRRL